ncbi:MAG: hypothetical protein ChlgKO_04840 [Chlamydiales bacterium]
MIRKTICFFLASCTLFGLEETFGPNPTRYTYPYITAAARAPDFDLGAGIGIRSRYHRHGIDLSTTWNYSTNFYNYYNINAHYLCYLQPSKINSFYAGLGAGVNIYDSCWLPSEFYPEALLGREIEIRRNKHSFVQLQAIYLPKQEKTQFAIFYGWGF